MGAVKDRLLEVQELSERVLSEHYIVSWGMSPGSSDLCKCGIETWPEQWSIARRCSREERRARAFAHHQAEMLADAYADSGVGV